MTTSWPGKQPYDQPDSLYSTQNLGLNLRRKMLSLQQPRHVPFSQTQYTSQSDNHSSHPFLPAETGISIFWAPWQMVPNVQCRTTQQISGPLKLATFGISLSCAQTVTIFQSLCAPLSVEGCRRRRQGAVSAHASRLSLSIHDGCTLSRTDHQCLRKVA